MPHSAHACHNHSCMSQQLMHATTTNAMPQSFMHATITYAFHSHQCNAQSANACHNQPMHATITDACHNNQRMPRQSQCNATVSNACHNQPMHAKPPLCLSQLGGTSQHAQLGQIWPGQQNFPQLLLMSAVITVHQCMTRQCCTCDGLVKQASTLDRGSSGIQSAQLSTQIPLLTRLQAGLLHLQTL